MLGIMIAPAAGVEINAQFIITLIAVTVIASLGIAGVGGGATFAAIIVLSTMNLPIALAAVLISIEPLIDMGRTAVNVSGSMTAGTITAKTGDVECDKEGFFCFKKLYGTFRPEVRGKDQLIMMMDSSVPHELHLHKHINPSYIFNFNLYQENFLLENHIFNMIIIPVPPRIPRS